MAAAGFEGGVLKLHVDGVLLVHHGGHWFESDAEINRFAVGNAALDSAGPIRDGANFSGAHSKRIVVLAACELDAVEAGADIESLGRGQTEHGFGEVGFKAVKDGFTPTGWDAASQAL